MSLPKIDDHRPRILICRLSHIGDCILTLPMVRALRKARPDAWIAWATENPSPQLLNDHPDLNEVIKIPKGWLKKPGTILSVRRELKKRAFDIAIDPQSLAKSAMLARVSGAAVRIGFRGEYGRELSTWFNNRTVQPVSSHLVDRSLELLGELGIEPEGEPEFDLPIRETAHCYIDQFLNERGINDSRFVVANPGASWPSKRWEPERFGELAHRLHEHTRLNTIVTWAGEEELEMAMSICAGSDGTAILAPKTDLQQLASLLQRSELFIGCDTGPLHLAAAVGTVCVGLYGPTRPQDSGAYGRQHYALQNEYQSGTSRQRRNSTNQAMRTISVTQVLDACCRALAAARLSDTDAARTTTEGSRDQAA